MIGRFLLLMMLTVSAFAGSPALASVSAATITMRPDGMDVHVGPRLMRVTALAAGALRVRIGFDGTLGEDASWAVLDGPRHESAKVRAIAHGFVAGDLAATVDPVDGRLTVRDAAGHLLMQDAPEAVEQHGAGFSLAKTMPDNAHYFGLGDKTGPLDRRGQTFTTWNTDMGFQETTDPIYKSIPFVIQVADDGRAIGLFLDNTWRGFFDFGKTERDVLRFGAEGGQADYYVLAGPTVKDVVKRYAALTGPTPLPPLWALGFQQSRWSYMSANEVRGIASRYRKDGVPLDVLYLDIDYQDRNRPFTVNKATFPDMAGLVRDLKGQGIRTVAITDLHIAYAPGQGYAPFDSGMAGDEFVKRADGKLYVGPVWPGPSVFPDFTRAKTRDWWGGLYKDFVADGIAGFWNDMNEPAVFTYPARTMPLDNLHRIEEPGFATRTASHAEVHNIFGMENSRATHDGLMTLSPDERPFVLTRASFAGGQRYAATWTGDNSATWSQLRMTVPMLLNLGMSGFALSGADVTGFAGAPGADLMTKWIEIGAFQPIFRDHASKDTPHREVWVNGPAHEAIRKRFIEARYRLMPYLYAVADEMARTGLPMMRPVFMDYPDALNSGCDDGATFLLGGKLLVAPPPFPDSPGQYDICLPKGGWFDYWTGKLAQPFRLPGQPADAVPRLHAVPALDSLPVFVRAGSIIPHQPLVPSTMVQPKGALQLDVYPGPNCSGSLYADDGHSLDYRRGVYLRQTLSCIASPKGMTIGFAAREGRFTPWWTGIDLVVHGWSGMQPSASLGGKTVLVTTDAATATLRLHIPDQPQATELRLTF